MKNKNDLSNKREELDIYQTFFEKRKAMLEA